MQHYFDSFTTYAFRLELLPEYDVSSEKEEFTHFLRTGEIVERNQNERTTIIRNAISRGAHMNRVHVLSLPLTDYLRFEIKAYEYNQQAGENIMLLDGSTYNNIIDHDFWLFDDRIVLRLQYDSQGKWLGYQEITENIEPYITCKNTLISLATSMDTYLARTSSS